MGPPERKIHAFGAASSLTQFVSPLPQHFSEEKGTTEDEMVGWYHQLEGHESEQDPGAGGGQGGLVCCSPWGRKESDTTEY